MVDNRQCHAPGDRCLGCPHYWGHATTCWYYTKEHNFDYFKYMIEEIVAQEPMDAMALVGKLFEEGGELAEATLVDQGYCQYKEQENASDEAADAIICILGILARLDSNQQRTPDEIIAELELSIHKKFLLYQKRVLRAQ